MSRSPPLWPTLGIYAGENYDRSNSETGIIPNNLTNMNDIDLRTIQQKQLDAERRLLTAQYQTKSKEVELRVLCGTILEK